MREAIKVLAAEGLVTMKMRRGAYVTEVNAKDLHDVFHLMAVLEADAAGTVASTATTARLQALEALHQQLEKPPETASNSSSSTKPSTSNC